MPANPALHKSLLDVPVRIDIVLGEIRMTVEELMALSPGEILALERKIEEELSRPLPDIATIQELKKRKLRIKEQLEHI